uniref:SCAN box domain-containing protein n=1 Tax=Knipowitschia caucasica TaxID=637954 RepID=A0AAV2JG83_KNICA
MATPVGFYIMDSQPGPETTDAAQSLTKLFAHPPPPSSPSPPLSSPSLPPPPPSSPPVPSHVQQPGGAGAAWEIEDEEEKPEVKPGPFSEPGQDMVMLMREFLAGQQRREEGLLVELRRLGNAQSNPPSSPPPLSRDRPVPHFPVSRAQSQASLSLSDRSPMIGLPTPAGQRMQYAGIHQGESPTETYHRLRGLYRRWIRPEERTKEEVGEAIIMEQLLRVFPFEVRTWVKEREPGDGLTAAKLAVQYLNARKGGPARTGTTAQRGPAQPLLSRPPRQDSYPDRQAQAKTGVQPLPDLDSSLCEGGTKGPKKSRRQRRVKMKH